jgi:hypothetical protein
VLEVEMRTWNLFGLLKGDLNQQQLGTNHPIEEPVVYMGQGRSQKEQSLWL